VKRAKVDQFLDYRQATYYDAQTAYTGAALWGAPEKAGSKEVLEGLLNDIAKHYLKDGKFLNGFDTPTIADLSFGTALGHIAARKEFVLPEGIAAYKERFAKACPTWEKVRSGLDGYIASLHAKAQESKQVSHGTLYHAYGTRSSKVLWLALTLGVNLTLKKVVLSKGEGDAPEYLAKNPHGGVPTLELPDGEIIYESSAIIHYLLDKFDPTFALTGPPGSKARNQFLIFNSLSGETEESVIPYFLHTILFGANGKPAIAAHAKEQWDEKLKGIYEKLITAAGAGNFANGTTNFSALDVVVGYSLNIGVRSGLVKSPVLEAYVTKIQQHAQFVNAHVEKE